MSVIEREARAQWDAMTDDERWSMHWTVRGNRADAKLAADRLEHQLEGAVEERDELRRVLANLREVAINGGAMEAGGGYDVTVLRPLLGGQ